MVSLIGRLLQRMEPTLQELDDRVDSLEEKILDGKELLEDERTMVTEIRKKAIVFRRYIAPQRDAVASLRAAQSPLLNQMHKRRLQESLNHLHRYIEDLDAVRDRTHVVKDELNDAMADHMNKNAYMLSVIAAIFLPLGFLTGLLGINVGGIPGAENPDAFMIFIGLLSATVILQVFLFKILKWF